ncbi:MAG: hypothetical protein DHS20C01_17000 [marine bacterium B5-7]|nr:MAG: hypothetical protein DHS20C01_17000 [marine bacterium B5-7]
MPDKTTIRNIDSVEILEARIEHTDTIAAFNVAMALETESITLDSNRVRAGVRAVFEKPARGFYLVARIDEKIIGCLMITHEWSDWRNGLFWWIQSVYVTPEHRGMGVYRRLYRDVLARAMNMGEVCGIRLYVEKDNLNARKAYEALGMSNSGYLVFEETLPSS